MPKKPSAPEGQKSLFPEAKKPAAKKEPMVYIVPATTRMSRCKGPNCRKPVYFLFLPNTARTVIVDCAPVYAANHRTQANKPHPSAPKCAPPVHPMAQSEHFGHGVDGQGIDHHFCCPDVAQFRRKTDRKNDGSTSEGGGDA